MRKDLVVFTFLSSLVLSRAIPIDKSKLEESKVKEEQKAPEDTGLYYDRYLREVIDVLETDEHFKEKLQAADVEDIKNGKLGQELDFVSHKVRTKLDELKRQEVARLRMLVKARMDAMQGDANGDFNVRVDHQALLKQFEHLDHSNPHRFEAVDLSNLIKTATNDLENFDEARHEEFKRYEMMKEHERREFLKTLDEERRQEEEQKHKEMMQKHQSHPKVNHPGSKDQLKEVWEDGDGMDPNSFDPKTFFKLHDFNEDGFFDQEELEALFNKELEKVYDSKNAEDDMHEMEEERVRMREHVMNEVDKNKDRLVSFEEFLQSTQTKEFAEPDGWETLDETEIYTEEELRRFEQELAETEAKLHAKAQDLREQHDALRKEHSQLEDRKQEYQQAVQMMEQKSQQITQEKHDMGQHEQPQNPGMKQPETHENPPVVVNKHQAVPEIHPNAAESVDGKAAHPIHLEGQGQGDGKVPLQPVAAEPLHV